MCWVSTSDCIADIADRTALNITLQSAYDCDVTFSVLYEGQTVGPDPLSGMFCSRIEAFNIMNAFSFSYWHFCM